MERFVDFEVCIWRVYGLWVLFEISNDNSKEGKCLKDGLFDPSSDGQTTATFIERTFETLSEDAKKLIFETWIDNAKKRRVSLDGWFVLLKDNAGWKERSLDGLFETWIDNAKERTPSLDEWFVLLKDIAGWGECSLDGLFAPSHDNDKSLRR